MPKIRKKDLTPQAARDDAQQILSVFNSYFSIQTRRLFPDFLFNISGFADKNYIELLESALCYRLLKETITNAELEGVNKSELTKVETAANSLANAVLEEGLFVQEMINLYAYAAGNETADSHGAQDFRLELVHLLFSSPLTMIEGYHSLSLESIERFLPRLAHALRLIDARVEIEVAKEHGFRYISPTTLALLADITYMAVIKKIKSREIPATKNEEGEWQIPLDFALDWLKKREKKLVENKNPSQPT